MRKRVIAAIIIVLVMLIPIPAHYKDGGSVAYKAVLYSVTDYHEMLGVDGEFLIGIEVKVLGMTVYEDTDIIIETE
jgi:hypothetical protein